LAKKVERAADGLGGREKFVELLEVSRESGDFFRDVATVAEEGDLFKDPLVAGIDIEVGLFEALGEKLSLANGDGGCDGSDLLSEGLQGDETLGEINFQSLPFFSASDGEGFESLGESWRDRREDLVAVVAFFDEKLFALSEEVLSGEFEFLTKVLRELIEGELESLCLCSVDSEGARAGV